MIWNHYEHIGRTTGRWHKGEAGQAIGHKLSRSRNISLYPVTARWSLEWARFQDRKFFEKNRNISLYPGTAKELHILTRGQKRVPMSPEIRKQREGDGRSKYGLSPNFRRLLEIKADCWSSPFRLHWWLCTWVSATVPRCHQGIATIDDLVPDRGNERSVQTGKAAGQTNESVAKKWKRKTLPVQHGET